MRGRSVRTLRESREDEEEEANAALRIDCRLPDGRFCAKCCYETHMPLTQEDIRRITSLGYRLEDFAERGPDGVWYLRNIDGHCVFLDPKTGRCRIYQWRPLGCRLYPLVYDVESGEVTVDPECPKATSVNRDVVKRLAPKLIKLIKRIYGELPRSA